MERNGRRIIFKVINCRGEEQKGVYELKFDGKGMTSGVYFYRIETGFAVASGRMLLMK